MPSMIDWADHRPLTAGFTLGSSRRRMRFRTSKPHDRARTEEWFSKPVDIERRRSRAGGATAYGNGVNVKSVITTSIGWPFDGAAPRKSHRFIRAFSPPGCGTSGPVYVHDDGAAALDANATDDVPQVKA
jgi:hypothetical protein